ncbi:hypothetical protein PMT_1941 [Prochlorococcus marinus str. MIT 9313]|uniref:Uncharacterized protein n=1 Tax=Prochlorococcus marinus (strain MIT 9313) TaxID=74547 RepID=Q7V4L0_PROMM|nr:hypothetical protein PMT_1941 [Prochlorococcus marinus str. MIT 9313]
MILKTFMPRLARGIFLLAARSAILSSGVPFSSRVVADQVGGVPLPDQPLQDLEIKNSRKLYTRCSSRPRRFRTHEGWSPSESLPPSNPKMLLTTSRTNSFLKIY